jgi:hypothetical protein
MTITMMMENQLIKNKSSRWWRSLAKGFHSGSGRDTFYLSDSLSSVLKCGAALPTAFQIWCTSTYAIHF